MAISKTTKTIGLSMSMSDSHTTAGHQHSVRKIGRDRLVEALTNGVL